MILTIFGIQILKTIFLLFVVAPVVESNPATGSLIVMEGETATLGCHLVKGNPAPEIKWRRKVGPNFLLQNKFAIII